MVTWIFVIIILSCMMFLGFHWRQFADWFGETFIGTDFDSLNKSLAWVSLTSFGGIGVQILLIIVIPFFRGEYHIDGMNILYNNLSIIVKDGGLLFFSVAVVVAVLADYLFSENKPSFNPFTVVFNIGIVPTLVIILSSAYLAICLGKDLSVFQCASPSDCKCVMIVYLAITQLVIVMAVIVYAFFMKFALFRAEKSCQESNQIGG